MKEHGHHHGFNLRVLYYDELSPKLKLGYTTDCILWNTITFYYHECFDELEDLKKSVTSSNHLMAGYLNNCINFVYNEMSAFCNEHKVPDPRPHKKGEMIPLPIDEYPIWFENLEDYIVELTWGDKDKKTLTKEVLPKLLNSFVHLKDVIAETDFSVKDSGEVEKLIDDVIKNNPDIVENYKKGKTGLINKLFGEVMKASQGKVNVKDSREMLEKRLNS
jgi:aspartyl-tRNA(Asn)/glutamyl-tRNA(Gln) amidotransferase subunit B